MSDTYPLKLRASDHARARGQVSNNPYVPGFDRWVVTLSDDSPDMYGYTDVAMGYFGVDQEPLEGAPEVIVNWWRSTKGDYPELRWHAFWYAGLVNWPTAEAWSDEVWGAEGEGEDEEDVA